jgi:uncharacterized protein YkwD
MSAPLRAAALAALLLAPLPGAPAGAVEPPLRCPDSFELAVFELVNAERAAEDLDALVLDLRLMEAAQLHSLDMATNDFLSHIGSNGSTPEDRIEAAGYVQWFAWGENAAAGHPTPEDVVAGWMASPGHRQNILTPFFEHTGVGYATDAGSTYFHYWTQVFGAAVDPAAALVGICPGCSDGADNDGDGRFDYGEDRQCAGDPLRWRENSKGCGIGFELALLLPLLRPRRR